MRAARFVFVALGFASVGCAPRGTSFERSCAGEYIDGCGPYEYAQVVSATMTPDRIRPSDNLGRATLHATFRTCGVRTPAPPALEITAVIGGAFSSDTRRDGGFPMGQSIVPLGTYFNTSADPLVFDAVIDNPFDATTIQGNTDLTLRFRAVVRACQGDGVEASYRTGTPLP